MQPPQHVPLSCLGSSQHANALLGCTHAPVDLQRCHHLQVRGEARGTWFVQPLWHAQLLLEPLEDGIGDGVVGEEIHYSLAPLHHPTQRILLASILFAVVKILTCQPGNQCVPA